MGSLFYFNIATLPLLMSRLKVYSLIEATRKIKRYCAYQERCHQEIVQKLRTYGADSDTVDHIIAHLIAENYLNEERFAKRFVSGKFEIKKWGKNKMIFELKARNIPSYIIQYALNEIEENKYCDTLDALARKRLAAITGVDLQKRKKKLADYLLRRGWERHLVYDKIQELTKQIL